jgi:hypothetical protein
MTPATHPAPAQDAAPNPHAHPAPFQPVALVAACLLPGAGHALLGDRRRGILIGAGVLGLFFGGLLIGGIDAVDRREDFVWFVGEALVGPIAFAVDYYHQNHLKVRDRPGGPVRSAYPNEVRDPRGLAAQVLETDPRKPPSVKSIGRVNELGTLFCTIAGMMNLIVIIDAAFRHRAPGGTPGGAPGGAPARAGVAK